MSNHIISKILDRPDAYLIIEAVKAKLSEEEAIRKKLHEEITEDDNIEFINGKVVAQLPVTMRHNQITGSLLCLLGNYVNELHLGLLGSQKLMISLTRNDYQPNICFFRKEKSSQFHDDLLFFPAPDLIIEILSDSTEVRDRGVKFKDYQAHGIEEYWIIDPNNETLEQYHLFGKEYQLILKSSTGDVKSFAVEGFQIPIKAIFSKTENLKAIQNLLSTQSSSTLTPPNS